VSLPITFVRIDELMEVGIFHNVLVFVSRGPFKAQQTERINAIIDEVLVEHPGGVVLSAMIESAVPSFFSARAAMLSTFTRLGPKLLMVMPIVDGTGIGDHARAAFLRGLQLLVNRPNLAVARSLDEAVCRILPLACHAGGRPVSHAELVGLFAACQQRIGRVRADSPSAQ
jgi:hypothetical protein